MHATTLDGIAEQAPTMTEAQRNWRIAAIALLSTRFIQGFIYWGGGSRRFIYAPSKLDPSAHSWMANKFQTAMPGALLGTDHLISFLLTHFYLLYAGVILFSAAELIVGAMLMTGLLTRLAALFSMGFSVLLMVMFGWRGALLARQRPAPPQARPGRKPVVPLGVGQPPAASDRWRLQDAGVGRARIRRDLRRRHLQLLWRLGSGPFSPR